ncbi:MULTISPECIES: DUF4244 domain-containing protein [Aeromicrobium]|uniref:DUF4244 domain-containing protein n=1 Tax=Aeromicrobium TaxID=2040 RepID=UPI00257BE37F|nr:MULTISPECIES: DUF4244 domain-containing protein [Aeromicrobium]
MHRLHRTATDEQGQVTAEFAVGALGAVTIAGVILGGPEAVVGRWARSVVAEQLTRALASPLPDLVRWPW